MSVELLQLLLLIIIANGSPIIMRALLKTRFNTAIDFSHKLPDGQPVFGESKTWRGLVAACFFTTIAAVLLGYNAETGLWVAIYAILGDLISSFIKRRLHRPVSSMAMLLDQVPESLFPALMLAETFMLDLSAVMELVLIFIITELLLSHVLYKWGIRKQPY